MKGLLAGVAIGALVLSLPVVSDAQTGKLSRQSETMRGHVETFLSGIKAA